MGILLNIIAKVPLLKATRLSWQKALVDRVYRVDIASARKTKDKEKVQSLERDRRFEIDVIEEEEYLLLSGIRFP